jgi:hypothetical protein
MFWVGAMALSMLAAVYGSIGWAGGMLLGFAVRGAWDRPPTLFQSTQ